MIFSSFSIIFQNSLDLMFASEVNFSPRLLYSLTADSFTILELRHLQQQTDLLRQLASNPYRSDQSEKEGDVTVDQSQSHVMDTSSQQTPQERVSLLNDCRIRRTQEDEVLAEVQRKCSVACYVRIKEAFEGVRNQQKINKQLEGELELTRKLSDSLLHFKEENDQLKAELQRALSALNGKHEQRVKLRVLQERNMNKEASVLKSEKNLLLKEKRILEMRKKAQNIFESVGREVAAITEEINLFITCYREIINNPIKDDETDRIFTIQQRVVAVTNLWEGFQRSLCSKLE